MGIDEQYGQEEADIVDDESLSPMEKKRLLGELYRDRAHMEVDREYGY